MKHLLATTALVSAIAFAAPAIAGTDVVLNGQFNFGSPTDAVGVDVGGMKVGVNVTTLNVTAIGNLNETNITGGVDTFDLVKTSRSTMTKSYDSSRSSSMSGRHFDVSYEHTVTTETDDSYDGSYGQMPSMGGTVTNEHTSLSVTGSAWSKSSTSSHASSFGATRTSSFSITKTHQHRVFVGSLQVNKNSGTSAIGVDAGGKYVSVGVKNLTVQAIGNANLTNVN